MILKDSKSGDIYRIRSTHEKRAIIIEIDINLVRFSFIFAQRIVQANSHFGEKTEKLLIKKKLIERMHIYEIKRNKKENKYIQLKK
jgi:hypothetical protein